MADKSKMENMGRLKDKNILVTGGTGFIGSHLVEALIKKRAQIVVPFRSLDPYSYFATQGLSQRAIMVVADIKDRERILDLVTKYEIEYIFHLAAQPIVPTAYYNPLETIETNIIGTANVLEAVRQYPSIKGVIVASSDKAYGKLDKKKYRETDALRGDHPYEASKSSADLIAQAYWETYKLPVVITRFGNVYGEGDLNFSRIIPGIMKSMIKNETLAIRSNGKYVRNYLYVKDVVGGYSLLAANIKNVKGEAFNFGSDDELSVIDLIKLVENTLNTKVKYDILNTAKNEIPYQSLDFSKIKKKLGWKPEYSIASTIQKIKQWYQKCFNYQR